MVGNVEPHARIEFARQPCRLSLPRVVIALETNHAQVLEPITRHTELERVKVHPTGGVVVRKGATESRNRRRVGYGPDLVLAGSGQQGPVTNLVLRSSARLASPDGHQDSHDLSLEPSLLSVGISLIFFKPRLAAAGHMQKGIEERFD
jgi:hypothetical protein